MVGSDSRFGSGKLVHKVRECPFTAQKGKDIRQQSYSNSLVTQEGRPTQQGTISNATGGQCQGRFNALQTQQVYKDSPDEVIRTYKSFTFMSLHYLIPEPHIPS